MYTIILTGLITFIILLFIDAEITDRLLKLGGREANPVIRKIYTRYGKRGLILFKAILALLLIGYFYAGWLNAFTIWFGSVFYAWMMIFMLFEIRRQKLINRAKECRF